MKTKLQNQREGSVLMIAMLTVTILTIICATSLYITSQNSNGGSQTAAWQQALSAAEGGVDAAISALNTNSWTNWASMNQSGASLPSTEPTSSGTPASKPDTSHYNYLPSSGPGALSLTMQGEGVQSVSAWVTVDTANGMSNSNGNWYRIRSTGRSIYANGSAYRTRLSNNRLDGDLRNTIALNFNRKGGSNLGPTRTVEVVMEPVASGGSARAITLATWLVMSGSSYVDAFSSPTGQWSSSYRDNTDPQLVATNNTSGQGKFNQNNTTYVYGGMVYSGTKPGNTNSTTVPGQVSTPDNLTIPPTSDPTASGGVYSWTYQNPWSGVTSTYSWTAYGGINTGSTFGSSAGTYATMNGGNPPNYGGANITTITANGTATAPALVILNGDFNISGSNVMNITGSGYVTIWVKAGQFNISGSGVVNQASTAHVTFIVDNDITYSGGTLTNASGFAADLNIIGVGTNNKVTNSGQSAFTGTIDAPNYSATLSGQGAYTGAIVANNLTISGQGAFHYDESLNGAGNSNVGSYAFASWFEDNSDPSHNSFDINGAIHPVVY